jgi:Carboxypeptidase regulatory-like domain/TonB dependent receptor
VRFPQIAVVSVFVVLFAFPLVAQSPNGIINGLVLDPSNRAIAGADILAINDVTGVKYPSKTNGEGIYVVPNLPPGPYRLQVSKVGFKTLIKPDIVLNVQDALSINFTLPVGAIFETMTVEGGAPLVDTENAAVSTVVDRQFAENLPMNGRSFQTLIQLTPGVVLTAPSVFDGGQFSVNGQRGTSNYWMVDGVSANFGASAISYPGNGAAGALPSFSVFGGTNSLVSVDALQEFRIQTSTFAPEFGRTPGAQISIVTRSGTNRFHGTAFDYVRNDAFDAENWFNGYTNDPPLPKAKERQNDFGGTLSGPVLKDRLFFFFSYEGLRLRLPQTTLTTVPSAAARQNATSAAQPYLNAFPLPNQPDLGSGAAPFNASYSDPATLDAYSLRVDQKVSDRWAVFGRYNYSPSEIQQRGNGYALSVVNPVRIGTQTATLGATFVKSSTVDNDLRLNYSRASALSDSHIDSFGGAVPLVSPPLPNPYTSRDAGFAYSVFSLSGGNLNVGRVSRNVQRQFNVLDNLSVQIGTHGLKFGVDFRRLSPVYDPQLYLQDVGFLDVPSAQTGNLAFAFLASHQSSTLSFENISVFAQDTWRIFPRLVLTYGLRWDVDRAPSSVDGPPLLAVTGYNLSNLSLLGVATLGTPPFRTTYTNFAPRFGLAYQLFENPERETVLHAGVGVFYDLATSEVGNTFFFGGYPFGATSFSVGGLFPLSASAATPPLITVPGGGAGTVIGFDPNLRLPYSLEWNVALQQALGKPMMISASYVGSAGRRLIQTAQIFSPNPNYGQAVLIGNTAHSNYNALQLQFQRRLSAGLQLLVSYTWSHSGDNASAGSFGNTANALVPSAGSNVNWGPSDFDIRNAFSAGVTYEIPALRTNGLTRALLGNWSAESFVVARSATPINVYDGLFSELGNSATAIRPDQVPGQPVYLHGSQYPGGEALNPASFVAPPIDPNTGIPLRQGMLGRNALRGFGAAEWDFSIHRNFALHGPVSLQFRGELFNILNHPNFGPPVTDISQPNFGLSTQTLAQSLGGTAAGGGAFNPLYQIGGPRSIQLALKILF